MYESTAPADNADEQSGTIMLPPLSGSPWTIIVLVSSSSMLSGDTDGSEALAAHWHMASPFIG
jgi:hypothetical protein